MLWSDTARPSGFSRGLCREEGGSEPKGREEGVGRKKHQSRGSETDVERGQADRRRVTGTGRAQREGT